MTPERKAAEAKAEKLRRREAALRRADLLFVAGNASGRRLLWWLVDDLTNAHGASYAGEDTHDTAYAEGRRSVGLQLAEDLKQVCPSDYVLMLREALERQQAEEESAGVQEPADGPEGDGQQR